jgi:serine/threonine protein kinase
MLHHLFLQKWKMEEEAVIKDTKLEILALKCIQPLKCPSLLRFHSGHAPNGEFVIVSQLVDPSGLENEILATRLLAIQSFFSAVAELHAAGIVHRDLKLDNVAVHVEDPTQAVVVDFGVCELPFLWSQDEKLSCCDPRYRSPEQIELLGQMNASTWKMTHGMQGPPSDVWAGIYLLTSRYLTHFFTYILPIYRNLTHFLT